MDSFIHHTIKIDTQVAVRNGITLSAAVESPEALYRDLGCSYPKFFKMDLLCKWAWVAAEALLQSAQTSCYEGLDKTKIAVVLSTSHGCLDVDRRYRQSMQGIPSPALFVYTLSNIMLGEICIRHGFQGEQACLVNDTLDADELCFWVNDLLQHRDMDACLCGWVDVSDKRQQVTLFWLSKEEGGLAFAPEVVRLLHQNAP